MPLWQSYRAIAPRTRLMVGVGVMAYATFGLFAADKIEEVYGYTPTEEQKREVQDMVPKIHFVDRQTGEVGNEGKR